MIVFSCVFVNHVFRAQRVCGILILMWLLPAYSLQQDALVTVGRPAVLYRDRTARWTKITETAMVDRKNGQVCRS